jgi:hypothetical protein
MTPVGYKSAGFIRITEAGAAVDSHHFPFSVAVEIRILSGIRAPGGIRIPTVTP